MVNKLPTRACFSRPFILLILLTVICSTANAQKISKYFTSSMQDNGVLYFIEPKQEFKSDNENCKLFYDLTYLTTNDTVTFNFTYSDENLREIDRIDLISDDKKISSSTNKIFIESKKDVWNHRYSAKFLFEDLDSVFQQDSRSSILINYNGQSVLLETQQKRWEKQSEILSKILLMIKANKKS